VTVENAVNKAKELLENNLENQLPENTPKPEVFKVGNYVGREEILHSLPAVTLDARNTLEVDSQEDWAELEQDFYVWAFIAEVDIENLHRFIMRYGEAIRKILRKGAHWGSGWHNPVADNTLYTGVFDAGHFLVQGCRVEVKIREIEAE